ncbi:MAG: hypothetical protein VW127_01275 [Flavobacteriaceae bacterium]|jgi:hypothetical protein
MEQNYFKKKHLVAGPRPLVIKRILAFSKYYNQNKKEIEDAEKTD